MNLVRGSARRHTTRSAASTACTWITRFARSTPTRVICSTDFPFPRFQIDDFEHHQSWRLDAVARNVGSPSHSARADLHRHGPSKLPGSCSASPGHASGGRSAQTLGLKLIHYAAHID